MLKFLKSDEHDEIFPIRIGYSCLKIVKEKHGKAFSAITDDDIEIWETVFEQALRSGYKAWRKPMPADLDIEDLMDEYFTQFTELVPEFFPEAKKKPGDIQQK